MGRLLKSWLAEEAYLDIKAWIQKIVWEVVKSRGGGYDLYDELIAEANYIFAASLDRYDPKRTELTTYVYHQVYNGLRNYQSKRRPEVYLEDLEPDSFVCYRSHCFLVDLLDSIGQDGRVVVRSILQPDVSLLEILRSKEGLRAARRGIRDYLHKHHQWSLDRIDDAFWSITTALWNITLHKRRKE